LEEAGKFGKIWGEILRLKGNRVRTEQSVATTAQFVWKDKTYVIDSQVFPLKDSGN
jgi:hypothetical protein